MAVLEAVALATVVVVVVTCAKAALVRSGQAAAAAGAKQSLVFGGRDGPCGGSCSADMPPGDTANATAGGAPDLESSVWRGRPQLSGCCGGGWLTARLLPVLRLGAVGGAGGVTLLVYRCQYGLGG